MKSALGIALKAAISIGLLYLALSRVDLGSLGERLSRIEWAWMLAALAVLGLQVFAVALRWSLIAGQCGAPITPGRAFRFNMIAMLFHQALPSTVGGDAARMWLLARDGAGWARAAYSVLVDRVIGVLALAVLVLACLPWSLDLIRNPVGRIALILIGVACLMGPAAFAAFGLLRWPWLERFAPVRHIAEAARVARAVFTNPGLGLRVLALSLGIHLLTVTTAWLCARSVAVPFDFTHALLLIPPVLLIATVPVSIAGWGVRESAMVTAFAYAGLAGGDGLLVSVLLGGAMFALGILGGIVWLASGLSIRPGVPAEPAADQTPR
jgi:glycosyltransferase 2 family protein